VTSLLAEAAQRQQQEEKTAERTALQGDAWFVPLSQVTGKVDPIDGLERVTMPEVFDYLRIPSKRREARLHVRIVELLRAFGWAPIFDRTKGKGGIVARGFERKPARTTAASPAPLPAPKPAPGAVSTEDIIKLRGAAVPLDNEVGKQFVTDCSRVAEGVSTAASIQLKYELDADAWGELMSNSALDRVVRRESEMRIRNGAAAMELAQKNLPAAQATLREILDDKQISPGHRVAAAKEVRETAAGRAVQPGVSEQFTIVLNFGAQVKPVHLEIQDPQPAGKPAVTWDAETPLPPPDPDALP
jgi:hypothetical protein